MTSPLFRTLQIGSLRYWGEIVTITEREVFVDVDLSLEDADFDLSAKAPSVTVSITDSDLDLTVADGGFILILESDKTDVEICT